VSGHDLLQTAGLRSCSAIASRTDPALALQAREVQCCTALQVGLQYYLLSPSVL